MYKPLPIESIALNSPVPVHVWDPKGVLLLRKGDVIHSEQHRGMLMQHSPMVRESDWQTWMYSYTAELDRRVRMNAPLSQIAEVAPLGDLSEPEARERDDDPVDFWNDRHSALSLLLHQAEASQPVPPGPWLQRLGSVVQPLLRWMERRPDDTLLLLVQMLFDRQLPYSASHALATAALGRLLAEPAGLSRSEMSSLTHAALTMNAGMARLQDELALQTAAPSESQLAAIRAHPAASVAWLQSQGVHDPFWLALVEGHHQTPEGTGYPEGVWPQADTPLGKALRLLQMADQFLARISPRRSRPGFASADLARALYLGPDGQPDPLGALFVKVVGMYPPGSYVQLASGETAVVVRRGKRANAPAVCAIAGKQGMALGEPAPRDTLNPQYEVRGSLNPAEVRVRVPMSKLLGR